jgi:hypothetical protein
MEIYTKNEVKAEYFSNNKKVFAHLVGNSNTTITRDTIYNLISDMDRTYETAGLLLGHSEKGKTAFDRYVSDHSVTRRGDMFVQKDFNRELQDLTDYAKEGFNAVIFVHLHPKHFSRTAITSLSMYEALNQIDKTVALMYSGPTSMKAGFVSAYEGILTRTKTISDNPLFGLSIFDISKGAEQPETFEVSVSGKAEAEGSKSSGLLRRLTRAQEDLKYRMDSLFKGTSTQITAELLNYPSSAEKIADIINKEIISNMNLPRLLKGRISAVEDQNNGTYTLIIKNPPGIFAGPQYKEKVDETWNRILEAVNARLNAGNIPKDAL